MIYTQFCAVCIIDYATALAAFHIAQLFPRQEFISYHELAVCVIDNKSERCFLYFRFQFKMNDTRKARKIVERTE
jgi:hypothetical protein